MNRPADQSPTVQFGYVHLALVFGVWCAIVLLFLGTARDMVELWLGSETYTHAILVPPIVAWLVWRNSPRLRDLPVRSELWVLVPMALVALAWLLAELTAVRVVAHFALTTLLVLSVPALVGLQATRVLAFPLLFLYFAVPFGDAAVPALMEWTADFTVLALRVTGVPVYREGLQFVIPSGTWSVIQACSGVRYLIASLMVGTLFAYLNYNSLRKRLVFVAVAVVVPIVANWLRAYMIVMIGHLSNNELAVGVDHLIYGWVFFGVVVGLMFLVGSRYADPLGEGPASGTPASWHRMASPMWVAAALVLMVPGAVRGLHWHMQGPVAPEPVLALPQGDAAWPRIDGAAFPWAPGYASPNAVMAASYGEPSRPVSLWVGYYRNQSATRKLVSSFNGVLKPDDRRWLQTGRGTRDAMPPLPPLRVDDLHHGTALGTEGGARMRVWTVYWINGRWIARDVEAKVWQAVDAVLGRGDDGAVLVLTTPQADDADATLEKFARAQLPAIAAALAAARDTR